MTNQEDRPQKSKYPPVYEKLIPIALGVIVLVIIVVLVVILGVALDLFPWAR